MTIKSHKMLHHIHTKTRLALTIIVSSIITACTQPSSVEGRMTLSPQAMVADTIYYPVRIKNLNPEDEWASERIKKLDRKKLVDDIFEAVYSGKATAYNYLTDAPIDANHLKQQENEGELNRDEVAELEFRETWWYDADGNLFEKKVQSILVASALYDSDGSLRGMKALFYVKTQPCTVRK